MAHELCISYTGNSDVYAQVIRYSDGKVWNGSSLVIWDDADIDDYTIPAPKLSGDTYSADFPSALPVGVKYRVTYYEKSAPGAPAHTDDILLGTEHGYWDGTDLAPQNQPSQIVF